MKLVLRKLGVDDLTTLERLVAESIDSVEPGLSVIDSRLMLGHATIDLLARDAWGSLVLIALGFKADESMLLRVVEAYSWCVEYPESVHRHYPDLSISEGRAPRVIFITDRVPDSFQRKIKQLSFAAVDAIEFRHIDVNGVPVMYFESVVRLRRPGSERDQAPEIARRPTRWEPARLSTSAEDGVVRTTGMAPRVAEIRSEPVSTVSAVVSAVEASVIAPPHVIVPEVAANVSAPAPVELIGEADVQSTPLIGDDASSSDRPGESVTADAQPVNGTADGTGDAASQKYLFSEALKASQVAQDFGIQLPKDGTLTRQWVDFLNQLASK